MKDKLPFNGGGLWQGHVIHILTLGPLLSMEKMKIVINILMVINIRCRCRSGGCGRVM